MLWTYQIFNVKIKGSSSSCCDLDLMSHFFLLLELAQELDSWTSLLVDTNPKLEPWKDTFQKMGRFFK